MTPSFLGPLLVQPCIIYIFCNLKVPVESKSAGNLQPPGCGVFATDVVNELNHNKKIKNAITTALRVD